MKLHSSVKLITSSSSEIYTVIGTLHCDQHIHSFLLKAAEFFGISINQEDFKVEVLLDESFVDNCLAVLERERERIGEGGYTEYLESKPDGISDLRWIQSDPWELFYLMHYDHDVGEPYRVIITNMKTKAQLFLGELYYVFDAVRSGDG